MWLGLEHGQGWELVEKQQGSTNTTVYVIKMTHLKAEENKLYQNVFALKTTTLLPLSSTKTLTQHELTQKLYSQLNHEVKALQLLQKEPTIVQLHDVLGQAAPFMQEFYGSFLKRPPGLGRNYSLVLEYCPYGTLQKYTQKHGPLTESDIVRISLELVEALEAMKSKGIIHRDLRVDNVLMGQDGIRVIDFDVCWIKGYSTRQDLEYSYYEETTAPEVKELHGLSAQDKDSLTEEEMYKRMEKADIYSVGCLLQYLISPQRSSQTTSKQQQTHNMTQLLSIVDSLLKENPRQRASLQSFKSALLVLASNLRLNHRPQRKRGSHLNFFNQIEPQILQTASSSKQDSLSISDWSLESPHSSKALSRNKMTRISIETAVSPKRCSVNL